MAHKTLIGGTAYEIGGGKTLINGTAYSIKNGKTLVGGTAYEVGFGPAMCTVAITADGDGSYAWLVIDGSEYYEEQTLELPAGTVIECRIYATDHGSSYIYLNGEEVFRANSSEFGGSGSYDYTVTTNCTIHLEDRSVSGCIYITEK